MDCSELERLLSGRRLSALDPEQRAAVAAHVGACQACRDRWGLDQQSQVFHGAAGEIRRRTSVKNDVMARIAEEEASQAAKSEGGANGPPGEPKRLGGFELLGRLGKGGMGTVLKARQVSMNRLVALKILPKKLAQDEGFVKRFVREARSAAALHHTNIVQAYDVGLTEGYYYFAMEYVEGEGLDAVLPRRNGDTMTSARRRSRMRAWHASHAWWCPECPTTSHNGATDGSRPSSARRTTWPTWTSWASGARGGAWRSGPTA